MRELVLKMSMSVDGFVAGAEGSDWNLRGSTPDSAAWVLDILSGAGTHAVGRALFESWLQFWPSSPAPMAVPVNEIEKVVFTRRPRYDPTPLVPEGVHPSWAATRVASGALADEIGRLKQGDGAYVLAQGGVEFGRSLAASGLVDEYRFAVLPVALGSGRGLFDDLGGELDLELVSSTAFAGGALGLVYRPRG